jgi:UDP-glucuronate decarboxylase
VDVHEISNLACPAPPIHYQFDPVQTTKTSVHDLINILGLAKRVKAKVFQASTNEVYGDPAIHPQTESYLGNVNSIGYRTTEQKLQKFHLDFIPQWQYFS